MTQQFCRQAMFAVRQSPFSAGILDVLQGKWAKHDDKRVSQTVLRKFPRMSNIMLFLLRDMMNTDTAKKIAEQREDYMSNFISEFMDEWDCIR